MADYKDIIQGTINNIVNKVKDVAENGTVRDMYDKGVDRAKSYGRIAKLTLEMNGESEELKRIFTEIGRLYYEDHKGEEPVPYYASLFSQAEEVKSRIEALDDELKSMKDEFEAQYDDSDIEVEICNFEDVVESCEAEVVEEDSKK